MNCKNRIADLERQVAQLQAVAEQQSSLILRTLLQLKEAQVGVDIALKHITKKGEKR